MRNRLTAVVFVSAAVAGGCTTASTAPATTPPIATPETVSTTMSTTTTVLDPATTTTVDRLAEIQAIFEDLERRRLQALYAGDREAFFSLFANTPYREESMNALETVKPGTPPELEIDILEVLRDDPECLVILSSTTARGSVEPPLIDTTTLQPVDGHWKYSYVEAGRGDWLCYGPHPLSG